MAQKESAGNQNGKSEENSKGRSFEEIKIPVPHGYVSGKYHNFLTLIFSFIYYCLYFKVNGGVLHQSNL